MAAIPFPTTSRPGARPALGQGRLVNAYVTKEGNALYWKRVPGLVPFANAVLAVPRGLFFTGVDVLAAYQDALVRVNPIGVVLPFTGSTLAGQAPVTFARNNNASPQFVAVAGTTAYEINPGALTLASYPGDPALIGSPNSVSFLDGYFLFTYGDGTIVASGLNTTVIDGLSNTKAESNPDGLLRGIVSAQLFYAMGPASIEVYQNAATSPFPLARASVIPVGLIGPWAVAGGQQEGWDGDPIFVARDGTVRALSGYQTQTVSTPDVTRDILAVTDRSKLIASVYVFGENAIWSLSSPDWTWEFNVTTREWHQRESYGLTRWRAAFSAFAFDRWLMQDITGGALASIAAGALTESGEPLRFEVESEAAKGFPARVQCRRADFDFIVGQGVASGLDPIETDPRVSIEWSDDGGATWSVPLLRPLGQEGRFKTLVSVLNTGQAAAQGRKWRLIVSDPVECTLIGGEMQANPRVF